MNGNSCSMRMLILLCVVLLPDFSAAGDHGSAQCRPAISQSTHFCVVPKDNQSGTIAMLLDYFYGCFHAEFAQAGFELQPPQRQLRWICFEDENSFNEYALRADRMDMSWLRGYYSARTNTVAIISPAGVREWSWEQGKEPACDERGPWFSAGITEGGIIKILHEAAHQLAFNSGLQKPGVMYPLWVSEGIATKFERDFSGNYNPVRARRLIRMHKNKRLFELADFVCLSKQFGTSAADKDLYAQCWGLWAFLWREHPGRLKRYLASMAELEPGPLTYTALTDQFVRAFGPVENYSRPFQQFIAEMGPLLPDEKQLVSNQ